MKQQVFWIVNNFACAQLMEHWTRFEEQGIIFVSLIFSGIGYLGFFRVTECIRFLDPKFARLNS